MGQIPQTDRHEDRQTYIYIPTERKDRYTYKITNRQTTCQKDIYVSIYIQIGLDTYIQQKHRQTEKYAIYI